LGSSEASLFVYSVFGPLPPGGAAEVLRCLLEKNLALVRQYGAAFCIDESTHELACYLRRPLSHIDVDVLKGQLDQLALRAHEWRQGGFERRTRDRDAAMAAGLAALAQRV